ncbi:MAG: LysE family transporter [Duncaniella sp.]|nr:LysE family transporter [Duncaniella sp.]
MDLAVILLKGALIGLLISAPMGPIGMLVIQRTLSRGRFPAFFTGIGASLSDFIYCLLTAFGLSFVTGFVESHQSLLQLVGSVVLAVYAVYLFFSNPSRVLTAGAAVANGYWKEFATGFLFTFSNPLILFLVVGLFARFNFPGPATAFYHYPVGFAGIVAGALGWWAGVTWFVDKVRAHFNLRSMWLVNRILASVIFVMGAVGFVSAVADMLRAVDF